MVSEEKEAGTDYYPKRRRPNFQSIESSYAVFLKFVKPLDKGGVDCTGMLSKDCYDLWLKTRIKKPSKPAESFRRALTAHCRGVDGRRPFPKDVEAGLLAELRKSQIWACFEQTGINIGLRGYKAVGHWEKKRKEDDIDTDETKEEPDAETCKEAIYPTKKNSVTKDEKNDLPNDKKHTEINKTTSTLPQDLVDDDAAIGELVNWVSQPSHRYSPPANIGLMAAPTEDALGGKPISNIGIISTLNSLHMMPVMYPQYRHCHGVYDALLRFNQQNSRMMIASMLRRMPHNQGLLSLTQMNMLEELYEKRKEQVIFSREFVKPKKQYCKFDLNKPVGVITADTAQFIVLESCETAKQIYKGDITGMHSLQLRVQSAHTFLYINELKWNILKKGKFGHERWKGGWMELQWFY
eukprot:CAMPEP_0204840626 /NCGR_PEP_ID=MMETSP1346-20131115/38320_1 /ASSEMBLY_ACC=CAM_ASM_000771 /TAXON_ID=215587 /ORGANISM="Aplanochytrium stocchinoi, Strain GSBS06" /LENGTH=408 /DNA_ID=CAMNT_0051978143 /DNA_START=123 /DNA_END=1350 /DNA_ORIENTATION=-